MIFKLFKNLFRRAKTLAEIAEANAVVTAVADAYEKANVFETYSTISGTQNFTLSSYGCFRVGNLLFMRANGTTTAALTSATNVPLVRIPIRITQSLVGGAVVAAGVHYPILKTVESDGYQYMAQGINSSVASGATIYLWGIYMIEKVGG